MSKKKDAIPSVAQNPEHDEYMLNDNLNTLHKAHKIKSDKGMMKKLHSHMKEKMSAVGEIEPDADDEVTSIKDLRKKSNKKAMQEY